MYFNVSQLLKETSGSAREYEVDDELPALGDWPSQRVVGKVRMLRTDRGIWVSASLDSRAVCTCSRCLVEHEQPIHMDFEEEYFPVIDIATGSRLELPDDCEEGCSIDHNHILDISEAVRQYSMLTLPMKPVCREDCAGLCATCGADLNTTTCACDKTPRDRRWGALLDLPRMR